MVIKTIKRANDFKRTRVVPAEERAMRDSILKASGRAALEAWRTQGQTRGHLDVTDTSLRGLFHVTKDDIKNVLLLKNIDGLTLQDIADVTGRTYNSIENISTRYSHLTDKVLLQYYITSFSRPDGTVRFTVRGSYNK